MCMIDWADGPVTMIGKADSKARVAHRCNECHRTIGVGETYHREQFVFDGEFHSHKTCAHCMVVRGWLTDECGGWCYGAVEEDLREHATGGGYGIGVIRLAVAMSHKWQRRDGALRPVPATPMTTHGRVARGEQ